MAKSSAQLSIGTLEWAKAVVDEDQQNPGTRSQATLAMASKIILVHVTPEAANPPAPPRII